jgi:hypothetical protein
MCRGHVKRLSLKLEMRCLRTCKTSHSLVSVEIFEELRDVSVFSFS